MHRSGQYVICEDAIVPSAFYLIEGNVISQVLIDLSKEKKVSLSPLKVIFSPDKKVTATAVKHVVLLGEGSSMDETLSYLAVAYQSKSDDSNNLAIMKQTISNDTSARSSKPIPEYEQVAVVENCNIGQITQILALTDSRYILYFVTLSLDFNINMYDEAGKHEMNVRENGPILNGCVLPNKALELFVVSVLNEELNQYQLQVYRRQNEKPKQTIGFYENQVLDLKISDQGNYIFVPLDNLQLERVHIGDAPVLKR